MKIITNQNQIRFKSGLNNKILQQEKHVSVPFIEKIFAERYGIEGNFMQEKSISLANKYCLKIFGQLADKLKLNLLFPPAIFVYERNQLSDKTFSDNFCIQETQKVLENEYPFAGRSIFFKENNNFEKIDNITEIRYRNKAASSSHFLSPFVHEWLHSFHLDFIYKRFGYGGNCSYMQEIYPKTNSIYTGVELLKNLETKSLSQKENEVVYNTLGEYATRPINQYLEVFSEAFTKFICDSLNGVELVRNPLEQYRKANCDLQNIIKKAFFIDNIPVKH